MPRPDDIPRLSVGRRLVLAALMLGLGVAAYWPVGRAGFVWDDDSFLTANALIKAGDGLGRFWASTQAPDYWPVTSSSLWLEWRLWGLHAAGYHWTNLGLHLTECLLLWGLLRRLRIPGAYLAALLFAVHPVNVESVAWIAQRKNLLAMLFYLLAIRWYLAAQGPAPERPPPRAARWLGLSVLAFVLGMLSKGSVATLPAVLALILWWQGRWSRREALRLLPYCLIAAVLAGVDVWFQHHGATGPIRSVSWAQRLLGAPAVLGFYLGKALWPHPLSFVYPQWSIQPAQLRWYLPLLGALALGALLWRYRRGWSRPLLFAAAYFALTLLPVLGFTDVYFMKYALVADHYQHLALIAVLALAAAAWAHWHAARPGPGPILAAALVVATLATLTYQQCRSYRSAESLYRSILAQNPQSWFAHNNLGVILLARNETAPAIAQFQEALRLKPDYPEAHIDLGHVLLQLGRPADAAQEFIAALALKSDFDREAHLDLGHAWFQLGRTPDALAEYRAALQIDPGYAEAHYSIGNIDFSLARFAAAAAEYQIALRLAPDDADSWNNLGSALVRLGRPREAIGDYKRALVLRPGDESTLANLRQAQASARQP